MEKEYIILSLLVAFLWGILPACQKPVLQKISTTTFTIFVSFVAFICSTMIGLYYYKHTHTDISKILLLDNLSISYIFVLLILCGFLLFIANFLYCYILCNNETYITAVIPASYPIITFIIAYLFLKEKITFIHALACLLIMTGVILFLLYP